MSWPARRVVRQTLLQEFIDQDEIHTPPMAAIGMGTYMTGERGREEELQTSGVEIVRDEIVNRKQCGACSAEADCSND